MKPTNMFINSLQSRKTPLFRWKEKEKIYILALYPHYVTYARHGHSPKKKRGGLSHSNWSAWENDKTRSVPVGDDIRNVKRTLTVKNCVMRQRIMWFCHLLRMDATLPANWSCNMSMETASPRKRWIENVTTSYDFTSYKSKTTLPIPDSSHQ